MLASLLTNRQNIKHATLSSLNSWTHT